MSNEKRLTEIDAIFHRAVRLRGSYRQRYLDEACGGRRELRAEVEELLRADESEDTRLDRPLVESLDPEEMVTLLHQQERHSKGDAKRANGESREPDNKPRDENRAPRDENRRSKEMQTQCSRGHFFDPADHVSCPHCGVVGLSTDMDFTTPVAAKPVEPKPAGQSYGGATKPVGAVADNLTQRKGNADDAPTQKYVPPGTATDKHIDPVVGWLVCVHGPDRGRDYRIRSQRNFIGRDQGMDICIASDQNVSRVNHATLIFDPRSSGFRIAPGDAHGMTYLNNEAVDVPMNLRAYDTIELGPTGSTKLVFIPFCGEAFQWH